MQAIPLSYNITGERGEIKVLQFVIHWPFSQILLPSSALFYCHSLVTLIKNKERNMGRGFIGYPKGRNRDIKLVN